MSYTNPTVSDFKTYFDRDFPYGATNEYVKDADIQRAIDESSLVINEDLFDSQQEYTLGVLFLIAHTMVMNLRASSQGIAGQFTWLQSSKGVGSVSEGLTIPQRVSEDPQLAVYAKTNYGVRYLLIVLPKMLGPISIVGGGTTP